MSKKIIAKAKFIKGSPRKFRYVVDAVRNLPVLSAIQMLRSLPHRAAKDVLKVYQQAVGNAKSQSANLADFKIGTLQVGEGPRYKRRDGHAHGARFDSGVRHKKLAHITLVLTEGKETNGAKS